MEDFGLILTIEDGKGTLNTRMTPVIMRVLNRLEGRRVWLKGGGLRLEPTEHNIETLRETIPGLTIKRDEGAENHVQSDVFDVGAGVRPYKMKTVPYEHQQRAAKKMVGRRNFALFMEQGTGKTKVAIDRAGQLYCAGEITGVLVTSPKGVHRQWVDSQIPEHSGIDFTAVHWPQNELPKELLPGGDLKWFTINIDGMKSKRGEKLCKEFIAAHRGRVLMIVDESHLIKNTRSARWKVANVLGQLCLYRLIMTGTPIAKDMSEEWAQMKWLDERIIGIRYMSAFRNEYCIMGGFEGRAIIGHKNVDRLKAKVDPYMFRATKDEIGILPKAYNVWTLQMTARQQAMITQLKSDLLADIYNGVVVEAANAAVSVMKMQQVSNGFITDEDGMIVQLFDSPEKNPRIQALQEYIESGEGTVAVWARFNEDIRQIKSVLKDRAVTYHGPTSDKDRAAAVQSFINEGGADFFVSNPAAGGTGLNLQGLCRKAVYYSNSDNSIQRWQSEDRIHRIGITGAIVYTDLVAVGSPDRKIIRNNKLKKSISDMALGDIQAWLEGGEW